MNETEQEKISFKEFKKKIHEIGYRYKTRKPSFYGQAGEETSIHLSILDEDRNLVCGSGASIYTEEQKEKHKEAFELLKKYKGKVFTQSGNKVLM